MLVVVRRGWCGTEDDKTDSATSKHGDGGLEGGRAEERVADNVFHFLEAAGEAGFEFHGGVGKAAELRDGFMGMLTEPVGVRWKKALLKADHKELIGLFGIDEDFNVRAKARASGRGRARAGQVGLVKPPRRKAGDVNTGGRKAEGRRSGCQFHLREDRAELRLWDLHRIGENREDSINGSVSESAWMKLLLDLAHQEEDLSSSATFRVVTAREEVGMKDADAGEGTMCDIC